MRKAERVFIVVLCVGCLAVPLAMMLGGALEPEEIIVRGNGEVVFVDDEEGALQVKRKGERRGLRVGRTADGKPVTEINANDIPTTVNEVRAHADAFEVPVSNRRGSGLRPEAQPATE